MVEWLVPSDRKPGGVLVVAKGAPRTFRSMWVGRMEESDKHVVLNEIGHVVRVRTVRRLENGNSGPDVVKLTATPSNLKLDGDDVEVQERWTPMPETSSWYDVKHVDTSTVRSTDEIHLWQRVELTTNLMEFRKEQDLSRVSRILCLIVKESQSCHPNHRLNLHRPRPRTHL